MLVVLIDEENLLDKTLLQIFSWADLCFNVVLTSSGSDSLYASIFGRYHRNIHQDDLLGNKLIAAALFS